VALDPFDQLFRIEETLPSNFIRRNIPPGDKPVNRWSAKPQENDCLFECDKFMIHQNISYYINLHQFENSVKQKMKQKKKPSEKYFLVGCWLDHLPSGDEVPGLKEGREGG
jgi:hypothetical protein